MSRLGWSRLLTSHTNPPRQAEQMGRAGAPAVAVVACRAWWLSCWPPCWPPAALATDSWVSAGTADGQASRGSGRPVAAGYFPNDESCPHGGRAQRSPAHQGRQLRACGRVAVPVPAGVTDAVTLYRRSPNLPLGRFLWNHSAVVTPQKRDRRVSNVISYPVPAGSVRNVPSFVVAGLNPDLTRSSLKHLSI